MRFFATSGRYSYAFLVNICYSSVMESHSFTLSHPAHSFLRLIIGTTLFFIHRAIRYCLVDVGSVDFLCGTAYRTISSGQWRTLTSIAHCPPCSCRSFNLIILEVLAGNVMSLRHRKATLIGLLETGKVNEWRN